MRTSTALKTLLRSPLKTILTFLLIAAASFAFFSRVTDYAVTTREAAKAESFYSGVAALDTSTPPIGSYYPDPKPWPEDAQIEKFSSLPGVTLADTRYMTDGLVEDFKRVIDMDSPYESGDFVLEGTFDGLETYGEGDLIKIYMLFQDVTVYAGAIELDPRLPVKINAIGADRLEDDIPYPPEFFETLEKGAKFLVVGNYSEKTGTALELGSPRHFEMDILQTIDGSEDDYLETEKFACYKELIDASNQSVMSYDIVYTSDMRAIPYVNEHRLMISEGRPLTAEDTNSCVVSEAFLEAYDLSVGDTLHIKLGDRLLRRYGTGGTRYRKAESMSNFTTSTVVKIIGTYQFTDGSIERYWDNNKWSYGPATIFVPPSLLPVKVPNDHTPEMGDFSVLIENPRDIAAFREAAEPLVAEMGVGMRLSDGGWSGMKDNFVTGPLASFLTTALYVSGAVLALVLAVYLYITRNKKSYAIMRMLGVPSRKAGISVTLPFVLLSVFAMSAGGVAGLFYASRTAAKTLAAMSKDSSPEGHVYVLDAAIPASVVVLCLFLELAFTFAVLLLFLQKMKKTPPLELLQTNNRRKRTSAKRVKVLPNTFSSARPLPDAADTALIPGGLDLSRLSAADHLSARRKYSALQQTCAYILLHMRRGIGRTAVSLALTVVLAAGIGMFILAKLSYQDASRELHVKGVATSIASSTATKLSGSDLVKDFYYYTNFDVRVNAVGALSPLTFTNDFDRYLVDDHSITYAEGYDPSVFERTGAVCLIGQTLSETLGIAPGDEITLMLNDLYTFMIQMHEDPDYEFYENEDEFASALKRAGKPYQVAGIVKSENEVVNTGVFSSANSAAENLYSQPFQIAYSEFLLADNRKLAELNSLIEEQKTQDTRYAPMASYHIDSDSLEAVIRIRNLLESLFPIAVAAAVLIGLFGPGLIIMQSAQEAAYLRILGVTKTRVRCMLVLEQIALCIAGILLVTGVLALFDPERFKRSIETLIFCWFLYFAGGVCGAFATAVQITRHKELELLQGKE